MSDTVSRWRLKIAMVLVLAACVLGLPAGEPDPREKADLAKAAKRLPEEFNKRPLLFVPLVSEAPRELKGDLSDPAWAKAAVMTFKVSLTAQPVQLKTEARVFCTAEAFYLGMRCEEPAMDSLKQDGQVWERDSFEFFIFPGEDLRGRLYSQVVLDAGNEVGVYRCHLYPRQQHPGLREDWQPRIEHATAKGKTGWTAEMKLLFADLAPLPPDVAKRDTLWRMALYRNRPGRGGEDPQAYAWSPTLTTFHHTAQRFGYAMLAPFATPALVEKVIERAQPQARAADASLDPAVAKEIHDLIAKLGGEAFAERQQSQDRLAELIRRDQAHERLIHEALRKTEAESTDSEILSRARKLLTILRDRSSPDEDPPPESVGDRY